MTNLIERLETLFAKSTQGPWQVHNEYSPMREQRCTIIANIEGETIDGSTHYTYQFCAQTLNEFADGDEHAEPNAALIVELVNNLPAIIAALKATP